MPAIHWAAVAQDAPKDQIGQLTIELAPFEQRPACAIILQEIRDRTAVIPGIKVEVRKREEGPPTGKAIRLQVKADSREVAMQTAARVRGQLEKMDDLIDIEDGRPLPGIEWELEVDREEAGRFGADVVSVGSLVQMITNGILVGTYRPDDSPR